MRLRLFERVRRLAHPRAGRLRSRRSRAADAMRSDRPGEARPPGRTGETRGQMVTADPEAGRHRRGPDGYAPPRAPWEEPVPAARNEPAPPWDQQPNPPPWGEPTSPPWARPPGPLSPSVPPPPSTIGGRVPPPAGPPPATLPPAGPPTGPPARPPAGAGGDASAVPVGGARARVRPDPHSIGAAPAAPPETARAAARDSAARDSAARERARARPATDRRWLEADRGYLPAQRPPGAGRPRLPFAHAHEPSQTNLRDGRRNCGTLETVLWRQWDASTYVPDEAVLAIDRLAELPQQIKDKLVAGLDGIFVGPGGVPQLDDMTSLSGVPLPSGRATWDACAGAYGERKVVVGTRPSPTPDVMCHEIGHALDDIDAPAGKWQSDSAEFHMLYDQCQPHLASDFHKQRGGLGRKEFFADAFAAIASRQRPALVDMLGGDTRTALNVMLYFNRRYGI
jgi:hypothetical protein